MSPTEVKPPLLKFFKQPREYFSSLSYRSCAAAFPTPIADDLPWMVVTNNSIPSSSQTKKINTIPATSLKTKTQTEEITLPSSLSLTKTLESMPSTPLKSKKRKEITSEKEHRTKIIKINSKGENNAHCVNMDVSSLAPIGTAWYQNSCAYDAILCIMHSIWFSNQNVYTNIFRNLNDVVGNLAVNFMKHASGAKTLESTRDDTRCYLHQVAPSHFRWGHFTSISRLAEYLLTMPTATMQNDYVCKNGHISVTRRTNNTCCLLTIGLTTSKSVAHWMQELREESLATCTVKVTFVSSWSTHRAFDTS